MPIQISCKCGKTLKVKDELAGKAVKCPGCGEVIRVAAAGAAAKQPTATKRPTPQPAAPKRPTPQRPPAKRPAAAAPVPAVGGMDDLFDEAGFSANVAAICPSCKAEMMANAVFCTKCGFNKETGEFLQSHKTAGVDIDHGTLALQKAQADIDKAAKDQKDLVNKSGMPWWMLFLILFMLGSGTLIAVIAVNASRQLDPDPNFDPLATFMMLAGSAFYAIALGANLMIVVHAFKESIVEGLLTLFVPFYILYHTIKNWSELGMYFIAAVVLGGIAGGFFGAAMSRMAG